MEDKYSRTLDSTITRMGYLRAQHLRIAFFVEPLFHRCKLARGDRRRLLGPV